MTKVLIISNIHEGSTSSQRRLLEEFTRGVNQLAGSPVASFCSVQELVFEVNDNNEVSIKLHGDELADLFEALSLRNQEYFTDYANAFRLYADVKGMQLINAQDTSFPAFGKVSQGFLFALNGLPTPPLVSMPGNQGLQAYLLADNWQYPYILKQNDGIKGHYNYLIKNEDQLQTALSQELQGFVAQPFIHNDGELRVLTLGSQAPLVFKKSAALGSHLNNVAQGSQASAVKVDDVQPQIMADALKAARLTGREIGGVDVLLGTDGKWYILEVNYTPAIATGAFLPEKQQAFANFLQAYTPKRND